MVNIGIIGFNYWGRNILRNLLENSACRVIACSDTVISNLQAVRDRYPELYITQDPSELLDNPKIDAVVLASDVSTHHSLGKRAIIQGKHVLFDKLIASSSEQADELVTLARSKKNILMLCNPLEYSPAGLKIKDFIRGDLLGKIYYIISSRINLGMYRQDIDVVWDLAYHDISLYMWWLDESPINVWAQGKAVICEGICDTAFINMEFSSGTMVNIEVSWLAPTKLRMTILAGSKKMLVFDDTASAEKIKIHDKGADVKNPESFGEFQLTYHSGDVLCPKIDTYEPLQNSIRHFIECVKTDREPRSNGLRGIKVLKILEAAERSIVNNGRREEVG
ncbi:MAG: Gfo/Idh/MocA family oxidoreductase [Candidatus Omnitrophica bacterium]|nr:Gfo/Idh/MocA family oxidoreductase [Candidatus Omnitrophota bacterium]